MSIKKNHDYKTCPPTSSGEGTIFSMVLSKGKEWWPNKFFLLVGGWSFLPENLERWHVYLENNFRLAQIFLKS